MAVEIGEINIISNESNTFFIVFMDCSNLFSFFMERITIMIFYLILKWFNKFLVENTSGIETKHLYSGGENSTKFHTNLRNKTKLTKINKKNARIETLL